MSALRYYRVAYENGGFTQRREKKHGEVKTKLDFEDLKLKISACQKV